MILSKYIDAGNYDVIVAGGGPAGLIAGIASARLGAKTLLVEREGYLGGMAATGLPLLVFHDRSGRVVINGLPQEFISRLQAVGGSPGHVSVSNGVKSHIYSLTSIYPEEVKYVAMEMFLEAGGHLMLQTNIISAITSEKKLEGLVVHNASGLQMIHAKVIIDCTGNGDVISHSGAAFAKGQADDGKVQSMTLLFVLGGVDVVEASKYFQEKLFEVVPPGEKEKRLIHFAGTLEPWRRKTPNDFLFESGDTHFFRAMILKPGILLINLTDVSRLDPTSGNDITISEVEARRQVFQLKKFLRKHIPGFQDSYLLWTPPKIGIREGRRLIGLYELQAQEVINGKRFKDSIGLGGYCLDVHDANGKGAFFTMIEGGGNYQIPFRCLVPKEVDGLLAAGRCISVSHEALASVRVMGICMVTGEAAGRAAALSVLQKREVRELEVKQLQDALSKAGALLE